jgi:hypothetical protein
MLMMLSVSVIIPATDFSGFFLILFILKNYLHLQFIIRKKFFIPIIIIKAAVFLLLAVGHHLAYLLL